MSSNKYTKTATFSLLSLLAMSTALSAYGQTPDNFLIQEGYNGPSTCQPKDADGNVTAPGPGDCAQFGEEGQKRDNSKAKNVILIIGDGMGQQEITTARNYLHGAGGRFPGLDALPATGAYTHHSIDPDGSFNYVTDSAASATAWSSGTKTYNGAVNVDIEGKPVENLFEIAKKAGMRTGNVTTSEIQDATPAGYATHSLSRKCYGPEENSDACTGEAFDEQFREHGGIGSISEQIIDNRADITLGGGSKAFDQNVQEGGEGRNPFMDTNTKWEKDKTVLENAKDNGFQVVTSAKELDAITEANQDSPVLGLFHEKNMTTRFAPSKAVDGGSEGKPLECEAQDTGNEPELVDMARKAIEVLDDKDSDTGFFLQIESASIDKRAHAADACGMIGEVERIDETIKEAIDFAKEDGETLVIVTADHSHSSQIIYDGQKTLAASTRLKTADGVGESIAYGTIEKDLILNDPKSSTQHTGAQLRVAAYGPGAANVIGQIDQTDVFYVMRNALKLADGASDDGEESADSELSSKDIAANNIADTCFVVDDNGKVAPGPGDCSQFGADGQGYSADKAKNVVIFIGDGTGDSEITIGRNYFYGANGRLPGIDSLNYTGNYTTWSMDPETGLPDYVTDSAASATGWNTGTKTYSGGLGINLQGEPVPNLAELARKNGLKIGNVTTSEIQDATPAAFATHALNRKCYGPEMDKNSSKCQGDDFASQYRENGGLGSISEQIVDLRADVTLGGGSEPFEQIVQKGGNWGGSTWTEGKSVLENAKEQGYQVVTNRAELEAVTAADASQPVLGLFSEGNMPRYFEQTIPTEDGPKAPALVCQPNPDRSPDAPTLPEMTKKAMDLLKNEKGFVLQVEGASVDKADHDADVCGQIGELGELDKAIEVASQWAADNGEETLIVMTADHAHTSQITANGKLTSGRATKLETIDGDEMTVNYSTAASNEDEDALGGQTHTGAQTRVAASGPGAQNVVGQIDQTDLFFVMKNALGLEDQEIDLSPQWDKASQFGYGSNNSRVWMFVALGVIVILVGGFALYASTRKNTSEEETPSDDKTTTGN